MTHKIYKARIYIDGPKEDVDGFIKLIENHQEVTGSNEVFTLECVSPVPKKPKEDTDTVHLVPYACPVDGKSKTKELSDAQLWCERIWGTSEDVSNTSIVEHADGIVIIEFNSEEYVPKKWVRYFSELVPTYKLSLLYNCHKNNEYGFFVMDTQEEVIDFNRSQREGDSSFWTDNKNNIPIFNWEKLRTKSDRATDLTPLDLFA